MRPHALSLSLATLSLALAAPATGQDACVTTRQSYDTGGGDSNGFSRNPSISADGDWIAFESTASDLVSGDTNGASDVFLRQVSSGAIQRISVANSGAQGNDDSDHPTISEDGLFVVFESVATNLTDFPDTNGGRDVFVYDVAANRLRTVSRTNGPAGPSANGSSGQGGLRRGSAVSADGRRIVFQSFASNLVPGDTNLVTDIFLFDQGTNEMRRMSVPNGGGQANGTSQDPSISADGNFVAYRCSANNLVPGDSNGQADIFRTAFGSFQTRRASVATGGVQGNGSCGYPSLDADGSCVAFESFASTLVASDTNGQIDVFLHDFQTSTTERISIGHDESQSSGYGRSASISADGMRVAFVANGANLVPNGSGIQSVYIRDRLLATTERWGEGSDGGIGSAGSDDPSITPDGGTLTFFSLAALEPADTNGMHDIYLRGCAPTGTPYCSGSDSCPCVDAGFGHAGCGNSQVIGGALLEASGTPSVFADTVLLSASGLPGNVPILFFQGTAALNGVPFGDGLRCVGGSTQRLGVRFASNGLAQYGTGGDLPVSVRGMLPAGGATRHYQGWYRDAANFCTPAGFNLTNGVTIEWVQ